MDREDTEAHFLTQDTIVIAGAGISGLSFAISIHKLWPSLVADVPPPPLILYERDPCAVPPGREGYSLSLRSDRPSKGIQTLQKMGILDHILKASITKMGDDEDGAVEEAPHGKGGFCVWDRNFHKVMKIQSTTPSGCPVASLRIARASLRQALVDTVEALPGVTIIWNEAITNVSPPSQDSSSIRLMTSSGNAVDCSVLIAADGASSKLRALLRPNDVLRFAGPTCVYGVANIGKHHPSARADEFGCAISGTGSACFFAPVDCEKMLWCLSWLVDRPMTLKKSPLAKEDASTLLEEVRSIGAPFGVRFESMVNDTDAKSVTQFNAMDKQPFAHAGQYVTGNGLESLCGRIVFLGDANHAVSPFAGNGANLAMMDAWDFAESLIRSRSLEEAIAKYDKLAMSRSKQVIRMSHFNIRVMHSQGWMQWFWCVCEHAMWKYANSFTGWVS